MVGDSVSDFFVRFLMKHTQVVVPFAWELASVYILMVGVPLSFNLAILVVAAIDAPSGSAFF